MRAGNRKCKRCKVVFYRERGTCYTICSRCRVHCSRCDRILNKNTICKSDAKRRHFQCKFCIGERVKSAQDTDESKWKQRDNQLIRTYGITTNEYDAIFKRQNGVCWICEKPPKENGKRLSVDHLHSRGENKRNPREKRGRVRGLLCWHCNDAISKFKDQSTLLRKAADYLEQWPAQLDLKEK